VIIENTEACERYTGLSITNVKVDTSPTWLQQRLKSIGLRPINCIVDITNYILHETGQPLHAFDAGTIKENKIIVKNLPAGTEFITLDEKQRKLYAEDLMICNGADEPMCFGGVFGGLRTRVQNTTTEIFLESAWFKPSVTRKTSIRHNLRTDAAIRFEKGVDISQTADVLKRAAMLIKEIAGGEIASEVIDVYPAPRERTVVNLKFEYLKKISGKIYDPETVKKIFQTLGFQIEKGDLNELLVSVPFSKPDITLPADVVEEIMRIDGLDNIEIPSAITISPAIESVALQEDYKEKTAGYLVGSGFSEIFTNSITNSNYYDEPVLQNTVKIVNSLSVDLDIMRPTLLESGLECIAYNLNRKNTDLLLFEFGNSYSTSGIGDYFEMEHLAVYVLGNKFETGWKNKPYANDFYFLKGICQNIFKTCGLKNVEFKIAENKLFEYSLSAYLKNQIIAEMGVVSKAVLNKLSIKQPLLFADIFWNRIMEFSRSNKIQYIEVNKFPSVNRDISIVVNKAINYAQVENTCKNLRISRLTNIRLFDVFESDKLGNDKKALALNLIFSDQEKTLTDKDVESMMNKIIAAFETDLGAEIRRAS
jgi:phenylalanyl-tRNA synthetase beta chain